MEFYTEYNTIIIICEKTWFSELTIHKGIIYNYLDDFQSVRKVAQSNYKSSYCVKYSNVKSRFPGFRYMYCIKRKCALKDNNILKDNINMVKMYHIIIYGRFWCHDERCCEKRFLNSENSKRNSLVLDSYSVFFSIY